MFLVLQKSDFVFCTRRGSIDRVKNVIVRVPIEKCRVSNLQISQSSFSNRKDTVLINKVSLSNIIKRRVCLRLVSQSRSSRWNQLCRLPWQLSSRCVVLLYCCSQIPENITCTKRWKWWAGNIVKSMWEIVQKLGQETKYAGHCNLKNLVEWLYVQLSSQSSLLYCIIIHYNHFI